MKERKKKPLGSRLLVQHFSNKSANVFFEKSQSLLHSQQFGIQERASPSRSHSSVLLMLEFLSKLRDHPQDQENNLHMPSFLGQRIIHGF